MRQYPKPNDAGQSARESACLYCFFALSQQARRITLSLQFSFSPPAIPPAGAAGQGTLSRLSTAWFVSGPPDGRSRYRLRSHGFALVVQSAGAHLVYPRIFRFGMTRSYRHGTVRPRRQLIIDRDPGTSRELAESFPTVPWASPSSHALAVLTFPAWHWITVTVAGAIVLLYEQNVDSEPFSFLQ